MKRIYLDYAASTPVDPAVQKAMLPYFDDNYGNPHALHQEGQEASRAVFVSRQTIAKAISADYKEIIFTASATEANNLALRGVFSKMFNKNKLTKPRIIISAIEHESVLETCKALEKKGAEVIYIPVAKNGIVNLEKIKNALNNQTVLVSVMYANNEVGIIQPIQKVAQIVEKFRDTKSSTYPLIHTDAVQAFQFLDCDVKNLGVDMMTLSAHKIYGPKGIGLLYIKKTAQDLIQPVISGGGQEFGLRSGTDNVPSIVGFAKSIELSQLLREKESKRIGALRDYFWNKLKSISRVEINGVIKDRLPNSLNVFFSNHNAHELQIKLDLAGIAASPGAACSSRVSKVSHVLREMGFSEKRASSSLRFSLGKYTTKKDLETAIALIEKAL